MLPTSGARPRRRRRRKLASKRDDFRTVTGVIQFPPREGKANGKDVRNITVKQSGFGPTAVNVSATVWPSHEKVDLKVGQVVVLEGPYTQNKGTDKDGNERVYHNLSVTRLAVLGEVSEGARVGTVNTSDEPEEGDEEIPF